MHGTAENLNAIDEVVRDRKLNDPLREPFNVQIHEWLKYYADKRERGEPVEHFKEFQQRLEGAENTKGEE